MGGWGISQTATPKEKLKSEMADFLNGLNSVGEISYSAYSEIFDFSMATLDKMYELAISKEKLKSEMTDFLNGLNSVRKISFSAYSEILDYFMATLDKMYELAKGEKGDDVQDHICIGKPPF